MTRDDTGPAPAPLRRNIAAMYASQAWVTLAGIVFVPAYLRLMGSEAYGLVAFFAVLQTSFSLLDLGLTRTISREAARFHADPAQAPDFRRLVRAMQVLFVAIAAAGSLLFVALADPIAVHWLRNETLPTSEVRLALQIMGVAVGLRWAGGLYRGIVVGAERIGWIAVFNAAIAALRFAGVVLALALVAPTTTVFFIYQLGVAVIELAGLVVQGRRQLPPAPPGTLQGWSLAPIRRVLGFSAGIAVTSVIWVLITQADKVVLSRLLPLEEFGHFSLGVLVAGAVTMTTAPIATPLLPRLARLDAEGRQGVLLQAYRSTTQLVGVLAFALAATFAAFSREILWAWTGDAAATDAAAPVLALFGVGNALLTVAAFPFYLQYAKGDLRLHVWGNLVLVAVLVPSLVAATLTYGMRGAAWSWLAINLVFLVLWVPVIHHRFAPGLHAPWLARDVLPIAAAAGATAWLAAWAAPDLPSRLGSAAVAAAAGMAVLAAAVLSSAAARQRIGAAARRGTALLGRP